MTGSEELPKGERKRILASEHRRAEALSAASRLYTGHPEKAEEMKAVASAMLRWLKTGEWE